VDRPQHSGPRDLVCPRLDSKYKVGVTSNNVELIPKFVKIDYLVQKLKWGTQRAL